MSKIYYFLVFLVIASSASAELNSTDIQEIVNAITPIIENRTGNINQSLSAQISAITPVILESSTQVNRNLSQITHTTTLNDSQLNIIKDNITNSLSSGQAEFSAQFVKNVDDKNRAHQEWLENNFLPKADDMEETRIAKEQALTELAELRTEYTAAQVATNATIALMQMEHERTLDQRNIIMAAMFCVLVIAVILNRDKISVFRREPT